MSAAGLYRHLGMEGKVAGIASFTGYPTPAFDQLCRPALDAFVESVQLTPASQAHHHASAGGMVIHGLEVVENALRRRKGYLLPQGGVAEEIARQEHIWTYAIFVAALLHDIGKPIADQKITITMPDGATRDWSPLAEPMRVLGATGYKVDFVSEGKNYDLHNQVAMTMYPLIVPAKGRDWLSQDRVLMAQLTAWLYGDTYKSGVIGEIVTHADGDSVAGNLRLGNKSRLSAAKEIPLVEKLLKSLRYLLYSGKLPINRDGAAGWVYQGHIWLLVPRSVDALRTYMTEQGYTGIPSDNERIFDILQEHGAILPTPKEKAVWSVVVEGEDYRHKFTAIRFPLGVLYRPKDYPPEMAGTVIPASLVSEVPPVAKRVTSAPPLEMAAGCGGETPSEVSIVAETPVAPRDIQDAADERLAQSPPLAATAETGAPPLDLMSRLDRLGGIFTDVAQDPEPAPIKQGDAVAETASTQQNDVRPEVSRTQEDSRNETEIAPVLVRHESPPGIPGAVAKKKVNQESVQFMQWVQGGLQNGEMAYNEPGAMVHFVSEGMLLVSPKIFQAYATMSGLDWSALQRKFVKSAWPIRAKDGKFVWSYQIVSAKKEGKGILLNGFLLDPKPFISQPPEPNPYLVLFGGALIGQDGQSREPGK